MQLTSLMKAPKKTSHRRMRCVAAIGAAAALVVGTAGVSDAATKVSRTSPDGNAYGYATIGFSGDGYVAWNGIYLNDRCPGDGYRATMKLYISQYGRTIEVGNRQDVGGCGSSPYTGNAHWSSGGPIDAGGIAVCSSSCSSIAWVYR